MSKKSIQRTHPTIGSSPFALIGEALVLLALPSALPVATGGIAHAMSVPIIIIAVYGLIFSALTERHKTRITEAKAKVLKIDKLRQLHDAIWNRAAKIMKSHSAWLFDQLAFRILTGTLIVLSAICFWTIIPLADTPPSVAVMLFGFALIYRDIRVWIAGLVMSILGIAINYGSLLFVIHWILRWLS